MTSPEQTFSLAVTIPDSPVVLYSADWCPYCERAKRLLRQRSVDFTEVNVDREPGFRAGLMELTGRMTVPQVLIGGTPIGGFDELRVLDRSGELPGLLAAAGA